MTNDYIVNMWNKGARRAGKRTPSGKNGCQPAEEPDRKGDDVPAAVSVGRRFGQMRAGKAAMFFSDKRPMNPSTDRKASGKKVQTRDAIRRAARKLFAAHPVESVSIDAIVAEAGVAKGSFYNHFSDRNDVVEAVVGEIRDTLNRAAERANADETDAARRVARGVCVFLRAAVDDPEGAAALVRIHGGYLSLDGPYNRPLVEDVSAGLVAGRFSIPTLESGVMLVIAVAQVGLMRIIQEPGLALAVVKAQQLLLLLLRGLGVETAEAGRIAAQIAEEVVRLGPTTPDP